MFLTPKILKIKNVWDVVKKNLKIKMQWARRLKKQLHYTTQIMIPSKTHHKNKHYNTELTNVKFTFIVLVSSEKGTDQNCSFFELQ